MRALWIQHFRQSVTYFYSVMIFMSRFWIFLYYAKIGKLVHNLPRNSHKCCCILFSASYNFTRWVRPGFVIFYGEEIKCIVESAFCLNEIGARQLEEGLHIHIHWQDGSHLWIPSTKLKTIPHCLLKLVEFYESKVRTGSRKKRGRPE